MTWGVMYTSVRFRTFCVLLQMLVSFSSCPPVAKLQLPHLHTVFHIIFCWLIIFAEILAG